MAKIALLYTERSGSEPGLAAMIDRVEAELDTDRIVLDQTPDLTYDPYDLLVFCGYDHITLARIHLALDSGRPLIILDEPGKSIERELNAVLFSAMDAGRIPPSFLDLITHSWNYKDIVAIAKLLPPTPVPDSKGLDRARPVEGTRKPSSRKGNGTSDGRGGAKSPP